MFSVSRIPIITARAGGTGPARDSAIACAAALRVPSAEAEEADLSTEVGGVRPRHKSIKEETPRSRFPCPDCADTTPYFYCDACRAEWDKREHEKDELRRAKQREQYKRRGKMWTPPRDKSAAKLVARGSRWWRLINPILNLINHGYLGFRRRSW